MEKGEELILTPTEFKLLRKFLENADIVLTRSVLLEELWDEEGDFVDEHTLTIFVSRLRSKIADEEYQYIQTIYGTGYQWSEKGEEDELYLDHSRKRSPAVCLWEQCGCICGASISALRKKSAQV